MDAEHSEFIAEFNSREEAMEFLEGCSTMPWDKAPNLAPCMSQRTCGRLYEIIEHYEDRSWYSRLAVVLRLRRRERWIATPVLEVSKDVTRWLE